VIGRARIVLCAGAACSVVAAAAPGVAAAARVSAFPSPGEHYARPGTTIALRGVTAQGLGAATLAGSRTGVHSFKVRAHSDGHGVSLIPDKPFARGETVAVTTGLNVRGARHGDFRIRIALTGRPLRTRRIPREAPDRRSVIQSFHSRPDLRPPKVRVTRRRKGVKGGYLFMAPKIGPGQNGPMIFDNRGQLVWFRPLPRLYEADGLRPGRYLGRPVLSWWEGLTNFGTGNGTIKMVDTNYRPVAEVRAGNGFDGLDPHEFELTSRGTAYVALLSTVYRDLSYMGGAKHAQVLDAVVQEIDIKTGLVLFEWHSLDHVSAWESYKGPPKVNGHLFDYFHINSIDEGPGGKIIVSSRNTWTVYRLNRYTGSVKWRLGGKKNSFRMGRHSGFVYQHDARIQRSGVITLFDNGAMPKHHSVSRGIGIRVRGHHARLVKDYRHSTPLLSGSQGDVQRLSGGHVLIGWGQNPVVSEYTSHGRELFSAELPRPNMSYRNFRGSWDGSPPDRPAAVASSDGKTTKVYVSWNGATRVARWDVLGGTTPGALGPVGSGARSGFETLVRIGRPLPYVAVAAKDAAGRTLGVSKVVRVGS
jgi:hypothetical protein